MHLTRAAVKALEGRGALLSRHRTSQQLSRLANQLSDSESRFRTLSDASPLGIYSTDANGSCTYTNLRWQEIYGLTLDESLGDGWQKGLHPEDIGHIFSVWQANASSRLKFDMEFCTLHKNGDVRFVHSRAKPTLSSEFIITGFVGSVQDITVQKKLTHENNVLLNTIARGNSWRGEFCDRAKDGSLYWVDSEIMPFGVDHQWQKISVTTL